MILMESDPLLVERRQLLSQIQPGVQFGRLTTNTLDSGFKVQRATEEVKSHAIFRSDRTSMFIECWSWSRSGHMVAFRSYSGGN